MSRKDFETIAKALRAYYIREVNISDLQNHGNFKDLVNDLMVHFREVNPNFDDTRFLDAIYDGWQHEEGWQN